MAITPVQKNQMNSAGTVTSLAVTLGSGATLGNLLVVAVGDGGNTTSITPPDVSWTQVTLNQPAGASATIETGIYYLVVDSGHAGGTSWTWTFGASHTAYLCIEEWAATNGWPANPVDVSANGDTIGTPVTSTTISSGTTATTAQAEELWIAALAYKGSAQSETSITSGWTKDLEATLAANNTLTMLYKVASATGAASCSYVIGTAAFWAGCVATFKDNVSVNFTTTITDTALSSFDATTSSVAGVQTITDTSLSSFSGQAVTTASTAKIPQFTATLAGIPVQSLEGSFEVDDSISSTSSAGFTVRDDSGTQHYTRSQRVTIVDSLTPNPIDSSGVVGTLFTGYVSTNDEVRVTPNTLLFSTIAATDDTYLALKRSYPGGEFTGEYAGPIFTEMLNTLTAEGVTAAYESRRETTAAQFGAGTLSGMVGANNVDDGDLELAPAGSDVSIAEHTTAVFAGGTLTNVVAASNTLAPTPIPAIKLAGQVNVAGLSSTAMWFQVWSGSHTILSTDRLGYYVWVSATSPEYKATVDMVCTDGTRLQDQNVTSGLNFCDENLIPPGANNDLSGLANGQWYFRSFNLGSWAGKTIQYVAVALGGAKSGSYAAYFRNITTYNSSTLATTLTIFSTTLATNIPLLNTGYINPTISVVPAYNLKVYENKDVPLDIVAAPSTNVGDATHRRVSTAYSVAGAVILKNSAIAWTAIEPANTQLVIRANLDNGKALECTKNAAIPGLLSGANLASRTLTLTQDFYFHTGIVHPEAAPVLSNVLVTVTSAPAATKTDVSYSTVFASGETGAVFSGTITNGAILQLIGATRTWDLSIGKSGYNADQTPYLGTAGDSVSQRAYEFGNPSAGNESKTRFDFAGQHQNFTAEMDVFLQSDIQSGFVYRSTNLSSNNGSYAYMMNVGISGIQFRKGTNTTGGGAGTTLATNGFLALDKTWHHIKINISGNTHQMYVDGLLWINTTDSSFPATGYIGAFGVSITQAYPQFNFDNFGVYDSTFPTWTSPSIPISSVGTYGKSFASWRDRSMHPSNDFIAVQVSLDGGTTYNTLTNNADMGLDAILGSTNLSGISMKFQIIMLANSASYMPGIDNFFVTVQGAYSTSGTRIGPSLALLNVGRLGNSVIDWSVIIPPLTTFGADVAINGGAWTDITSNNGAAIPGLAATPDAILDTFNTDTHTAYTNTHASGGSNATVTYNTAASNITVTGGSVGLYWQPTTSFQNGSVETIIMQADQGGLLLRFGDVNNFYVAVISDASASSGANIITIKKVVAGAFTTLSFGAIAFTRGTPHVFKFSVDGSVLTAYFDGVQICTSTDSSISAIGSIGLYQNGGTAIYYSLRSHQLGDDMTSTTVQTRFRLASTDPTVSPQVLSHTIAAYGQYIAKGALIPQTTYKRQYIYNNLADLAKQSNYWWNIKAKQASFLPMAGIPAPWVLTGNDALDAGLVVSNESPLYRNYQIITNVIDTATVNENRLGDSISQSWVFGYAWASAPTITVNGTPATVGIKSVDTGRQFYYAVGDFTIIQDTSGVIYDNTFTINFQGTGQFTTESIAQDLVGQAILAALESSSGIVENVEDGQGITKAAGDTLAQARINQYSILGQKLAFQTTRIGLAIGQLLNVFIPEHNLTDSLFLIRGIRTISTPKDSTGVRVYWYTVDAISGPDIGTWLNLYKKQ